MSNIINFTDVNPLPKKVISKIKRDISNSINKKDFILGDAVKEFEIKFSKIAGARYAVGCANGTDALILSLMSLNLKKNDEVIVPGLSYISTGLSVILTNSKLVFVDVDQNTGLISIEKIKEKITKKTKAIIPVNLYGQRVNLLRLRKVVGKKISIIEDSAQSHFAFDIDNKKKNFNNLSETACYSFYPAKNLGAYGDGGLITTNKKNLYNKLLALRNLGSIKKNKHFLVGKNSRLDTIQAVVLSNKLKNILLLNEKRRNIAKIYDEKLKEIKEIKLTRTNAGSSRHLYVIRVKKRDKLIKYLKKRKIACQIHYSYSLNKLKAFEKKIDKIKLKNSERWALECMSLPMHPNLTKSHALRVIDEIKKYFGYN